MIIAAAYARYSSDNQRQESIDAQLRAIREYCKKNNYSLEYIYADEALTGTTDKREQFLKMIEDCKHGLFSVVIVHKLDRFSRDRYDSAFYKREIKRNNVKLFSVLENLDDSPESIITESILEGMAEYYSKNLAREVRKGMNENALKAKHNGGVAPLGYNITQDKGYEINETEAEAVKKIFNMYIAGYGYGLIIKNLNQNGYKTKLGAKFGKNSIADILRNEKYVGRYVFNKRLKKGSNRQYKPDNEITRIDGAIPAIIDLSAWEKAQSILNSRKKLPRQGGARVYILTGKLFCGECGAAYVGGGYAGGRGGKKYYQYKCANSKKECINKSVRQDVLENYVINLIKEEILNTEKIDNLADMVENTIIQKINERDANLPDLIKRRKSTKLKLDKLFELYLDDSMSKTVLREQTKPLEEEIQIIDEQIKNMEKPLLKLDKGMVKKYLQLQIEKLENADASVMQSVINTYVDKITINIETIDVSLRVDSGVSGGGEGSRTPVRNHILQRFYGCIPQFNIPDTHPPRAGSTLPYPLSTVTVQGYRCKSSSV